MISCFPFPPASFPQFPNFIHYSVLVYPLLSHCLTVALAWVVNVAGTLICIVIINNELPARMPQAF